MSVENQFTYTIKRGPFKFNRQRRIRHQIHRIFSVKAGMRNIEVEGVLEADVVFMFEGDPTINGFTEQDPRIPVSREGSPYTTMDFSVRHTDGTETFIEVKPVAHLIDNPISGISPKNWDNVASWASADNYRLAVITDLDLANHKQRICNWRRLLPFVRHAVANPDDKTSCDVFEIIAGQGQSTLNQLMNLLSVDQRKAIPREVARLLHTGKLDAGLDKRVFTMDTPIKVSSDSDAVPVLDGRTNPPTEPAIHDMAA